MPEDAPAIEKSLYRKYRSRTFADLIGQSHVTQTLRNGVQTSTVGHAYLLSGPRGTGKTSVARILARAVNCLTPVEGDPCDRCAACEATRGECLDIVEIDAASHGKVEHARELRERVNFTTATVARKVYIIDEAHMLSDAANDALLKTLEEPPAHVMFVLATTEAHKLKATVASRCQRLDFRAISPADILARLEDVAAREGIAADAQALAMVARHAGGSLRDALSLLDQVRAYRDEAIGVVDVEAALGLVRGDALVEMTDHVVAGDCGAALGLIDSLGAAGADMQQYARQLVGYWRDLLLACAGAPRALERRPDGDAPLHGGQLSVTDVSAMLTAVLQPDYSGRRSASAQWQLELAIVEACRHFASPSAKPSVPSNVERAAAREPPQNEAMRERAVPATADGATPDTAAPRVEAPRPESESSSTATEDEEGPDTASQTAGRRDGASEEPPRPARDEAAGPRNVEQIWADVLRALSSGERQPAVLRYLKCTPIAAEDDAFVLGFAIDINRQQVEKQNNREVVEDALRRVLGRPVRLRCVTLNAGRDVNGGAPAPPAESFKLRAERAVRAVHVERDA